MGHIDTLRPIQGLRSEDYNVQIQFPKKPDIYYLLVVSNDFNEILLYSQFVHLYRYPYINKNLNQFQEELFFTNLIAPLGYYPFQCIDYFYILLMTLIAWGICLLIWLELIEAGNQGKFEIICCSAIFQGFYVNSTLATYYGGRMKKVIENQMIEYKLMEMQQKELEKEKLLAAI